MTRINPILRTDSYKHSHWLQYPQGTSCVVSYIEARGWSAPFVTEPDILFLGISAFIAEYMSDPITMADVDEAEVLVTAHGLPFNREGWERIVIVHNGYFPVTIQALPEGTVAKAGIPLVQVWNNDPQLPWVTSFIETALLRAIWYPTTVGTLSREAKKVIAKWLEKTADNLDGLPFKLHDFGARGATSSESAMLGGLAHLVNFMGTDTIEGLIGAQRYYNFKGPAGFSIPASEHSTITTWGRENEVKAFNNMLDKFGTGLVACVSDSYDIFAACSDLWGTQLKEKIETMGGTLVVRPDSGDPVETTFRVIELLGAKFGWTKNTKGYKVLPPHVRIIQGDGVNINSINEILRSFAQWGWSADNIAFGMGGALLQKVDRDSLKFAMKANAAEVNNVFIDVYKDPITDKGKRSKRGPQSVIKKDGRLVAVRKSESSPMEEQLQTVYNGGWEIYEQPTLDKIRARAAL